MSRIQPNMLCLIINAPAGTDAEKRPTVVTCRTVMPGEYIPESGWQLGQGQVSCPIWLCKNDLAFICIPERNLMPIGGLKEPEAREQEVFA